MQLGPGTVFVAELYVRLIKPHMFYSGHVYFDAGDDWNDPFAIMPFRVQLVLTLSMARFPYSWQQWFIYSELEYYGC
jgi:hypothetical protein